MKSKDNFDRSAESETFDREIKRVNVDFPVWMVKEMDEKARRLGISRQALVKVWISDCLRSENKMAL
ncbi:MAG: type II toxin-antitoxin system BrnA family antitoxin [Desulfovibrio sp.]|jgi:metal-responsive CopG/Arc/MetJ family transcriptional regulator|uniref:type II toxin-antitoxin system BrnA family antitoxin n=1 Tax=Desulfovibrio sp. 7SRBS1 TaxID=3378064 RepID=UPI003B4028A0